MRSVPMPVEGPPEVTDWHPDALRALAVAVLTDALLRDDRRFLTADYEAWRTVRRRWLEVLDLDVEPAEAALRRLCALPWAERQARLAALAVGPTAEGPRRWDRTEAFAGVLETGGRRRDDAE